MNAHFFTAPIFWWIAGSEQWLESTVGIGWLRFLECQDTALPGGRGRAYRATRLRRSW